MNEKKSIIIFTKSKSGKLWKIGNSQKLVICMKNLGNFALLDLPVTAAPYFSNVFRQQFHTPKHYHSVQQFCDVLAGCHQSNRHDLSASSLSWSGCSTCPSNNYQIIEILIEISVCVINLLSFSLTWHFLAENTFLFDTKKILEYLLVAATTSVWLIQSSHYLIVWSDPSSESLSQIGIV